MPESPLRAFLRRPDVVGGLTALAGAAVTFYPPDGWWRLVALLAFALFAAALIRANIQQEAENAQALSAAMKSLSEQVAATNSNAAELRAVVAKRERDVLREGTLKQRALLLGAEMYQFMLTRQNDTPMRKLTSDDGVFALLPDAEWMAETRAMFRERFSARITAIVKELQQNGVKDSLLSAIVKLYDDDVRQMLTLGWHLQEVAGRLPDHPDYPQ